jgi:hypothetical protein
MEELSLSQIPSQLIEEISKDISDFVIGLVRLRDTPSGQDAELGGSGTLVQIDETYGILTAHHVLSNLPKDGDIGLILATRFGAQLHRYTIPSQVIRRVEIARGQIESEGPDLALLIIPAAEVELIKAFKSFYNLVSRRDEILVNPPDKNDGIWFISGFANELTTDEPPEHGYQRVKSFYGMFGAGGVRSEYTDGLFDYFDFEVRYGGIDQPPESFGGFSGGGLWQVPLIRSKDGKLEAKDFLLSGVICYQSPMVENRRFIKCHGRRSVYKCAIDAIKDVTLRQEN